MMVRRYKAAFAWRRADQPTATVGDNFCSEADRAVFEAGLGKRIPSLNGGEIAVARALETIEDCTALRTAVGDSIRTTLVKALHLSSGAVRIDSVRVCNNTL